MFSFGMGQQSNQPFQNNIQNNQNQQSPFGQQTMTQGQIQSPFQANKPNTLQPQQMSIFGQQQNQMQQQQQQQQPQQSIFGNNQQWQPNSTNNQLQQNQQVQGLSFGQPVQQNAFGLQQGMNKQLGQSSLLESQVTNNMIFNNQGQQQAQQPGSFVLGSQMNNTTPLTQPSIFNTQQNQTFPQQQPQQSLLNTLQPNSLSNPNQQQQNINQTFGGNQLFNPAPQQSIPAWQQQQNPQFGTGLALNQRQQQQPLNTFQTGNNISTMPSQFSQNQFQYGQGQQQQQMQPSLIGGMNSQVPSQTQYSQNMQGSFQAEYKIGQKQNKDKVHNIVYDPVYEKKQIGCVRLEDYQAFDNGQLKNYNMNLCNNFNNYKNVSGNNSNIGNQQMQFQNQQTNSSWGQQQPNSNSIFGANNTNLQNQTNIGTQPSNNQQFQLFPNQAQQTNLIGFGDNQAKVKSIFDTPQFPSQTNSIFGQQKSTLAPTPSLFGQSNIKNEQPPLFGQQTGLFTQQPTNIFNSNPQQPQQQQPSIFQPLGQNTTPIQSQQAQNTQIQQQQQIGQMTLGQTNELQMFYHFIKEAAKNGMSIQFNPISGENRSDVSQLINDLKESDKVEMTKRRNDEKNIMEIIKEEEMSYDSTHKESFKNMVDYVRVVQETRNNIKERFKMSFVMQPAKEIGKKPLPKKEQKNIILKVNNKESVSTFLYAYEENQIVAEVVKWAVKKLELGEYPDYAVMFKNQKIGILDSLQDIQVKPNDVLYINLKLKDGGPSVLEVNEQAPVNTRPNYVTYPCQIALQQMTEAELQKVNNFQIWNEYVLIEYIDEIDLRGVNIDKMYQFEQDKVIVHQTQKTDKQKKRMNNSCFLTFKSLPKRYFEGKGKIDMIIDKIQEHYGAVLKKLDTKKKQLSFFLPNGFQ